MAGYSVVLAGSFLYGGLEAFGISHLPFWKSWLMVPYWLAITAAIVALSYRMEKRLDRGFIWGFFCAFVVLDAGYWYLSSFPHNPFPVYNWWAEWWPWNSIWGGRIVGEPVPIFGFPYYYLPLTLMTVVLWRWAGKRRSF